MYIISAVFFLYEFILRVSPGAIAVDLRHTFHINAVSLGLLGSAFFQAYALMQIPVGIILDKYNANKTLTFACFLCAFGTIVFAVTTQFWIAIIARFIIGFGAAFAFVGALKVAEQWLPIRQFALASGMLMTLGALGAIVCDNLLVWLVTFQSWSTSMLYIGIFGIALSIITFFAIQDPEELQKTQVGMTFTRIYHELVKILRNPYIWLNAMIGCCLYFPTSAFAELWGKSYLQQVFHFTPSQSIFAVTTVFLGWAVGAPINGWLSDFFNNKKFILISHSLLAAILISIVLYGHNLSYISICWLLFLFGAFSSIQVIVFVYAKEICHREFSATAIAITNMIVVLAGAFSQFIIGWLLDLTWTGSVQNGIRFYNESSYQFAFLILPLTLLFCGFLTLFLRCSPGRVKRNPG